MTSLEDKLASVLAKYDLRDDTSAVRFALSSPSREWSWEWASPGSPEQYFIASTTKLYVSAVVMQLRAEGRLSLSAPAATYLDASVMPGIHVLDGVDHSGDVTVGQLLSHTSGIADYFEQKRRDGGTQIGDALVSDFHWSFEDVLRITKEEMEPHFAPGTPGKAYYSDTNFQLLGAVIEAVADDSYEAAVGHRIIAPLELSQTYPFTSHDFSRFDEVAPMLYGEERFVAPKLMASVRADGGIVSSAIDGLTFLRAFMTGGLFPADYVDEMQATWRKIFPPLQYGMGMMRFALPRYYTLWRRLPPMVGHSGATGCVLYYVPELDLYVSGTVNQIKKRSLSYNVLAKLVMACQSAWDVLP